MSDQSEFGSFVQNCYLKMKEGEVGPLFFETERPDGRAALAARLDGYAIVPIDEWNRLQGAQASV